jgi:hypothetical protein
MFLPAMINNHLPNDDELNRLLEAYANEIEDALKDEDMMRPRLVLLAHSIRNLTIARQSDQLNRMLDQL